MLAKSFILKKRSDFEVVKDKGRLYQSPLFGMLVLSENVEETKFGFLISKKVSKRAVDRNRIRRLTAEAVRFNLKGIKKKIWVVFLVKRKMLGLKQDEVRLEVENMMKMVGII